MSDQVNCQTHGVAGEAFICAHALDSYESGQKSDFFWTDASKPSPSGWCSDCNQRLLNSGGDWVEEAAEKLDAKLICEHCFRDVIKFNGYS